MNDQTQLDRAKPSVEERLATPEGRKAYVEEAEGLLAELAKKHAGRQAPRP